MDVTKSNFSAAADEFERHLAAAEFVSFDLEMTGIRVDGVDPSWSDPTASFYRKAKRVASTYNIIQIGLAIFEKTPEGGYVSRPFNFFLIPASSKGFNPRITFETAALEFNRDHGMDFNKWVREGVPYMPAAVAKALYDELGLAALNNEEKSDNGEAPPEKKRRKIILHYANDQKTVDEALEGLEQWTLNPDSNEYLTAELDSYLRAAVFQLFEEKHPEFVYETRDNKKRKAPIAALRLTPEEKAERQQKLLEAKSNEYSQRIGFRRIWTALAKSGKPIVGHNCMFDLLFLYHHLEAFLPDSLSEYKTQLHSLFSTVFDTKYLCSAQNPCQPLYEDTALGSLFEVYRQRVAPPPDADNKDAMAIECAHPIPNIQLAQGFDKYTDGSDSYHEAGFDAYITGCVFLFLSSHFPGRAVLPYANRLQLSRSMYALALDDASSDHEVYGQHLVVLVRLKEEAVPEPAKEQEKEVELEQEKVSEADAHSELEKEAIKAFQQETSEHGHGHHGHNRNNKKRDQHGHHHHDKENKGKGGKKDKDAKENPNALTFDKVLEIFEDAWRSVYQPVAVDQDPQQQNPNEKPARSGKVLIYNTTETSALVLVKELNPPEALLAHVANAVPHWDLVHFYSYISSQTIEDS
eukprot:TRINITY_DN474_c0_g2_i2.p1 TRINITY_DN474_c0_g2~~TRINITY_DN474_c0_g2_i2.p1  ORF type:complete len:636 (+),score=199.19 TRINITY_DN474_c0_g2_i2:100-2007(+)